MSAESFSPKKLTAFEIEAILKAARDGKTSVKSDVLSSEPLGPGDVQYLQNSATGEQGVSDGNWPVSSLAADELLEQAERYLAEAIGTRDADSIENATSDTVDAPPRLMQFEEFLSESPVETKANRKGGAVRSSASVQLKGLEMEALNDLEVDVTLEVGRAEVTINELLSFREGSVVPLDKDIDEPIDILANGRLVARGEIILVGDCVGVRICEVIGRPSR